MFARANILNIQTKTPLLDKSSTSPYPPVQVSLFYFLLWLNAVTSDNCIYGRITPTALEQLIVMSNNNYYNAAKQ